MKISKGNLASVSEARERERTRTRERTSVSQDPTPEYPHFVPFILLDQPRIVRQFRDIRNSASHLRPDDVDVQQALREEAGEMRADASFILQCGKEIQTLLSTTSAGYSELSEVPWRQDPSCVRIFEGPWWGVLLQ